LVIILFEEDFVGSQGPQFTVVLGNNNNNNKINMQIIPYLSKVGV
jgi:hypothetical protein